LGLRNSPCGLAIVSWVSDAVSQVVAVIFGNGFMNGVGHSLCDRGQPRRGGLVATAMNLIICNNLGDRQIKHGVALV
jgi:hypothetical protein